MAVARTHPGSEDMPIIPGMRFRVHDSTRPQPRVVHPGTASTQENPGEPPSDAVILFDGVELSATVLHNGLVVHHHTSLLGPTQHRQLASYQPHAPTAPLWVQDHGDAVRYRNIWYRPLKGYDEP